MLLTLRPNMRRLEDDLARRERPPQQAEHLDDPTAVPAELDVVERSALVPGVAGVAGDDGEEEEIPGETGQGEETGWGQVSQGRA